MIRVAPGDVQPHGDHLGRAGVSGAQPGALFLLAGMVLLGTTYALTARQLLGKEPRAAPTATVAPSAQTGAPSKGTEKDAARRRPARHSGRAAAGPRGCAARADRPGRDRAGPGRHGRARRRLAGGGPDAAAAAADHRHRAPDRRRARRRPWPGRADRAGRAARRAEGPGRHVRRHAGPAGPLVRRPVPVHRERVARASHPADPEPHADPGGAGDGRGLPAPAPAQRNTAHCEPAARAADRRPAAARPARSGR